MSASSERWPPLLLAGASEGSGARHELGRGEERVRVVGAELHEQRPVLLRARAGPGG